MDTAWLSKGVKYEPNWPVLSHEFNGMGLTGGKTSYVNEYLPTVERKAALIVFP